MRVRVLALALLCAIACGGLRTSAHHAIGAHYREQEVSTIRGVVVQLVFRNPHAYVYVTAPGRGGDAMIWAVECGTPRQIAAGAADERLKPGDFVVVSGNPARDTATGRLYMKHIVRPSDGRRWSAR